MMMKTGFLAAAVAALPLAFALTLETPSDWQSGTTVNISWATASDDVSTWSLELVNPDVFHDALALSNNVPDSDGYIEFELPDVENGTGYYLQAVNVSNINDVYAESGEFSIAAAPASLSVSSTVSGSYYSSSFVSATTTSGSASASASASASGSSGAATSTSTSAAAAATTSTDTFNAASARFDFNFGSLAVMALGTVAGAVMAL